MKNYGVLVLILSSVLVLLPGGSASMASRLDEPVDEPMFFKFARVRFSSYSFGRGRGGRTPGWAHDYPRAERNLLKIISELTKIQTSPSSYVIVDLDDPRIMDYPMLYFSEPGTWSITEAEAANLRKYLLRGGFAIFDDFDGGRAWRNFSNCMKEVFPERELELLTVDDPVFQCFFNIETLDVDSPYGYRGSPLFYGMRDDSGRLQVVVNFNNDLGDLWEWSDESYFPISLSNEAYKFGINYMIYALSH